jgi:hypothetical protein
VSGDEYVSEVEYKVSRGPDGFTVRAVDAFDGEEAEVYDVIWDGAALSFATHWASTGKFVKCRFLPISPNRVNFTYTSTQQEIWQRRESGPVTAPKPAPARRAGKRRNRKRRGQ